MSGGLGSARGREGLGSERGSVTAELALALPVVIVVLLLGVSSVAAAGQLILAQDAASVVARAAARGESRGLPSSAPSRASLEMWEDGALTCARVTVIAPVVGIPIPLEAASCALGAGE